MSGAQGARAVLAYPEQLGLEDELAFGASRSSKSVSVLKDQLHTGPPTGAAVEPENRRTWSGLLAGDGSLVRHNMMSALEHDSQMVLNLAFGPRHGQLCGTALQYSDCVVSAYPGWLSLSQWELLQQQSQTNGHTLYGVSLYRCQPVIRHLRALLRNGVLGPLFNLRGTYVQSMQFAPTIQRISSRPRDGANSEASGASAVPLDERSLGAMAAELAILYQWLLGSKVHRILAHRKRVEEINPRRQEGASRSAQSQSRADAVIEVQSRSEESRSIETELTPSELSVSVMVQLEDGTIGSFSLLQTTAQSAAEHHLVLGFDGPMGSLDWDQSAPEQMTLQLSNPTAGYRLVPAATAVPGHWQWRDVLRDCDMQGLVGHDELAQWVQLSAAALHSLQSSAWVTVGQMTAERSSL